MDIQKAGDNSTQLQAGVINIYNGITEERARGIYKEEYGKITELTQEAKQTALQRVCELENRVIPKLSRIENGLEFFSNPDFQFLLIEAQKAAARSERPVDYDLLSELLLHRVKNDSDKEKRLGIKKAVEIVDSISDEALVGLTVLHSVTSIIPTNGDVDEGLDILEDLYGKIVYDSLPEGENWLDHLDILGAIRIVQSQTLKPLIDIYSSMLNGYVCVGIPKKSEKHEQVKHLLDTLNVTVDALVDHVLNPGYVRLNVSSQSTLDSVCRLIQPNVLVPLSNDEIKKLDEVFSLYEKDNNLMQKVKQNFSEMWGNRKILGILKEWWSKIPNALTITEVGKVLARANAQRCDKTLPPLK